MKARSRSSSIRTKRSSAPRAAASGTPWTKAAVLRELQGLADPRVKAKMAYFGVRVPAKHGLSPPVLQRISKGSAKSQGVAEELWRTGIHEARILATFIGEPHKIPS